MLQNKNKGHKRETKAIERERESDIEEGGEKVIDKIHR